VSPIIVEPLREFVVSWSCPFEADSPEDAAEQAWAALEDAVRGGGPTSVLVVRYAGDESDAGTFDMAYTPPIEISRSDVEVSFLQG
jgi:hypothetical protein